MHRVAIISGIRTPSAPKILDHFSENLTEIQKRSETRRLMTNVNLQSLLTRRESERKGNLHTSDLRKVLTNEKPQKERLCLSQNIKMQESAALDLPNLASAQLGAQIVFATDEWFSQAPNMLQDSRAKFDENTFTEYGKEMDGWECRRRRTEGNDWAVVKLGMPGIIDTIEVDTLWFTGNFSPQCSVYGAYYDSNSEPAEIQQSIDERAAAVAARGEKSADGRTGLCATEREWELVGRLHTESWSELVPLSRLGAGYEETSRTFFKINSTEKISHLRLNMGPDGGIARIRVYGTVSRPAQMSSNNVIDLAYITNGGLAIGCSNMHYGHPRNLTMPGRGLVMGDGWETARQPKRPPVYEKGSDGLMLLPGNDWAVLQLGMPGILTAVDVDTNHYKGNYPESCFIEGCELYPPAGTSLEELKQLLLQEEGRGGPSWFPILSRSRLTSSAIHSFGLASAGGSSSSAYTGATVTHVRITIYPDGGVQRLRVWGRPAGQGQSRL